MSMNMSPEEEQRPQATRPKDRSALRGLGEHILDVLANHTTDARWGEWMWAPFERAAANGDVPLSCALFKAGATGPHLHPAVRGDHGTLVSELLKLGAAPSAKDEQGDAALHVAAGLGRTHIVEMLLAMEE
ncbi:unnamed protein product, partial [Ectocarpus sp. 12 AP-2014]